LRILERVAAVQCSTALQDATTETGLEIRIGIHQGEIAVDGERVFGDGINIASRLQALADPGGS
jgi:adenylate cyclase